MSRGRGAVPVERDPLPKVVLACLLVMAGGLLLVVAVRPLPGAALVVGRGRVDADRLTAHRVTVLRGSLLAPVPPDKPVRPIPSFQVAADALTRAGRVGDAAQDDPSTTTAMMTTTTTPTAPPG